MKKTRAFLTVFTLIFLCLTGCQPAAYDIDFSVSYSQSGSDTQLKVSVVNKTKDKILSFSPYISKLEKENNGKWESVAVKEEFYQSSALLLPTEDRNAITETQNISPLEKGTYRAAIDIEIYEITYTEADDSGGTTVPVKDKDKQMIVQTVYAQFTVE